MAEEEELSPAVGAGVCNAWNMSELAGNGRAEAVFERGRSANAYLFTSGEDSVGR